VQQIVGVQQMLPGQEAQPAQGSRQHQQQQSMPGLHQSPPLQQQSMPAPQQTLQQPLQQQQPQQQQPQPSDVIIGGLPFTPAGAAVAPSLSFTPAGAAGAAGLSFTPAGAAAAPGIFPAASSIGREDVFDTQAVRLLLQAEARHHTHSTAVPSGHTSTPAAAAAAAAAGAALAAAAGWTPAALAAAAAATPGSGPPSTGLRLQVSRLCVMMRVQG
jgi:hypothetical protein